MRVWIDLANSPHPPLFAPVARRLEAEGHEVLLTVRDHAQTAELAREIWPSAALIGGESPGGRVVKSAALLKRIAALRTWAREVRPDVALSHNSYAQIAAARMLGIPAVTAMDFEHQPANHLAFRLAKLVLLPDSVPARAVRRQGATERKIRRYPGLKEALYLGDFEPDPGVLNGLSGVTGRPHALVVGRTPPSRALYHRAENVLFVESLKAISAQGDVACVVLARHPEQRHALKELALPNVAIPEQAVDARSLMYRADLFLGAGGTMTREAALMGIPTVSVFSGKTPAVDLWLEQQGMLRRITSPADLIPIRPRDRAPHPIDRLRAQEGAILQRFVDAVNEAAPAGLS